MISEEGIFDKDNALEHISEDNMSPLGSYIYVEKKDNTISVQQDSNGAFGLCIYTDENFYGISNSVVALIDHMRQRGKKLTLNRDYANMFIADILCNMTLEASMAREISFVEPGAEIRIDIATKDYQIIPHRFLQSKLSLDTEEGIRTLDSWYDKWARILSGVAEGSSHVAMDLNGGFDTRLAFAVTAGTGKKIGNIRIRSYTDRTHTHAEDFRIASDLADAFGIMLNDPDESIRSYEIDKESVVLKNFFSKLSVHKELFFIPRINITKQYRITGDGGESIRTFCDYLKCDNINNECGRICGFSREVQQEIRASVSHIMEHDYDVIHERFPYLAKNTSDDTIALFRATYNRNHFGRNSVESCISNVFRLEPLLDPNLFRIKMYTDECRDRFLLAAMILLRYCPRLLDFPIEGNRKIDEDTLAYVKKLSDRFPYQPKEISAEGFIMPPEEDIETKYILSDSADGYKTESGETEILSANEIRDRVGALFESEDFQNAFCADFNHEIYDNAKAFSQKTDYFPHREINAVLGIMYVRHGEMINI